MKPNATLATLCLAMLMPALDTSIANTSLPNLAPALGASFQSLQWIVLAYLLSLTTLIVAAGRLADMLGRRRLMLAGIALFTIASLACGLAPGMAWLLAARAVQGLGAAVMMALAVAAVGAIPKERAGAAMGLLGTMSALGTCMGPAVGGMLTAGFGWRAIFLVNVPIGLFNFVLAWRSLPADPPRAQQHRFDLPGMLVLAATLAAFALALTTGRFQAALLLSSLSGVLLFLRIESRSPMPLVRLSLLHPGLAGSMLVAAVIMSTLVAGPFYLARSLGLDAARAGLALSAGPLMAALAGIPAGKLVDRFGAQRMVLVAMAGMALACATLARVAPTSGLAGYLLPLVLLTASYAQFQAANNTGVMAEVDVRERGVMAGLLGLSRNLGLLAGTAFQGAVFAWGSGGQADAAATTAGTQLVFASAVAILMLAVMTMRGARFVLKGTI